MGRMGDRGRERVGSLGEWKGGTPRSDKLGRILSRIVTPHNLGSDHD